ncbi:UNVERIFIED_CONTAM: Caffeic acid 3-O-methyltransferase [Sesamum latifolium]|uniref:Caffeic acid 3-O-methyltransferase n=1 Tax=Sesamum latifolium TaxID=2727402 RepID=A0AAW2XE50_9LAMI
MADRSEEEETFLFAMELASASVLSMALKSAIELDLLELIKKAGPGASASPSQLAAQLPTQNPDAATMIDRILRLLAAHSVVRCSLKPLPDGGVERRYSLAPVCKFLTRNEDGVFCGSSCAHAPGQGFHGVLVSSKRYSSGGRNSVQQGVRHERVRVPGRGSSIQQGFEGVKSLVDVGGGIGASLKMILSKYPSIKAINFDLPHVIQDAPSYPGVEHIGGDMFVSVPKADAIFMKWICHDWSDSHCQKLLKNCYDALPDNGKVIIADSILPEDPNSGPAFKRAAAGDVIMLAFNPGGKERSEKEFHALAQYAGFREVIKVCSAFNIWIIEFHK